MVGASRRLAIARGVRQNMKYTFSLILALLISTIGFAQTESKNESYFPLKKGISKTLTWYNGKYREVIKDTVILGDHTYTEVAQIFPPNEAISMYYRESNDTIFYFNEEKKLDTPFFGIKPKQGESVANGVVKKVGAKLKTPVGKLEDLLVIEMTYSNGQKDTRYYKKGLGLVAVKNNNRLICYFVPD